MGASLDDVASPTGSGRLRKRWTGSGDAGVSSPRAGPRSPRVSQPLSDEELEARIAALPSWGEQLTVRGLVIGTLLGLLFAVITLKLSLGSAGIIPSLSIAGGLISFAVFKAWTSLGPSMTFLQARAPRLHHALFQPFGLQENSVLQTFILSISGVAFTGGFGTYLTGMGYQAYLNLGGAPKGSPGFDSSAVYEPTLAKSIPYLLMTAVLGVFMLTQMRKLMIVDWRLPFPSGTASGIMLSSFHTAAGEAEAMRKVRYLGITGLASFCFSILKWLVNGTDFGCGFGVWPTFGLRALKYTWSFDFQQNYIGAGMICPHIVNFSMLLGAILSWGLMWPLLEKREGDWYPADLGPHDFQGLFGYKVFLTIAILMGEGMYMVFRVLLSTSKDARRRLAERRAAGRDAASSASLLPPAKRGAKLSDDASAAQPDGVELVGKSTGVPAPRLPSNAPESALSPRANGSGTLAACGLHLDVQPPAAAQIEAAERNIESLIQFKETPNERRLRTEVFLREVIPWWLAPLGYGGLGVLSTIFIPLIYPPVKWYYVLVAYIITPLFALPNSYGTGLTDWDNCSMYGKLALFIFAAWAGATGNGVIVGLGICGVVFGATSSAATLMSDFRTGYICLTAPRAMFVAQLVGQLLGAMLAPVAFMLFYSTGQVNVPGGPYPAPFSDIYRGMALIGVKGMGALPKYCSMLMLLFFAGGIAICILRDLLPKRYGRFVPSPMAIGIPFYIGANSAIDFWLGSVVMLVWEALDAGSAEELGPTVGAGLLVGDGVWSIPSSMLAILAAGKAPPICMGFYGRGTSGCALPYCMGFWLGGSERVPHA